MATRRNVAPATQEKLVSPAQGGPSSDLIRSDTRPAVPIDVIVKLLAFTFAMIILPIGSYFFTRHFIFRGNATYSGIFAAVMANVVLVGYIVVAMKEDMGEDGYGGFKNNKTNPTGVDVLKRQVESRNLNHDKKSL